MWGLAPVKGVFREVSGNGTVSPDGEVSGTVTVTAASIDTKNTRRDTHPGTIQLDGDTASGRAYPSELHRHIRRCVFRCQAQPRPGSRLSARERSR
jgi:hypothetical protein